ncbi:MAG: twin-arginine translocase subunit TatC, partial [Acidobacteria bacterium]|nr:twin-arginine translocase subunit TatC [Acidobacteriota bacterium]
MASFLEGPCLVLGDEFFGVGQFLTLLFMTTAAMGVVFQVPVVMIALQRVGLIRHKTLLKHWRTTILIIFCASALFSPPEPVSMFMMALPMMLLYGVGLILTWIGQKRERPADEVLPRVEKSATFSIVAVDPESGVCGAAVASKYPAVGKVVPYVRAGVGAFCTQHWHVPKWGDRALDLLEAGKRPEAVFLELLQDDDHAEQR